MVTLTAKNKGAAGSHIQVAVTTTTEGLTVTLVKMAGGQINPDITPALRASHFGDTLVVKFNKAPLPFQGQKRNFLKIIRQLDFSGKTVVDLFGGSGVVSHAINEQNPSVRVIYNDFDDYQARLDMIPQTEQLKLQLQDMTKGLLKSVRISDGLKQQMIEVIKGSDCTDYLTISSWLLFSGNYAQDLKRLIHGGWYARVVNAPLNADGYLKSVERVQCDFRQLLDKYSGKDVVFIADPPYIMTDQNGYAPARNQGYFRLRDSMDCVRRLSDQQALFFSSIKSETDDLLEVWPPERLKRVYYKSGIGDGRTSEDVFIFSKL